VRPVPSSIQHRAPAHPTWPYRLFPPPSMPWQGSSWPDAASKWSTPPLFPDTFTDPFREYGPHRRARSTLEDVPMPDYIGSSSSSSRAISNMTGISFQHNKQPSVTAPIDEEQYNQLIEALSPYKEFCSGPCAPTNTPVSVPTQAT